MPVIVVGGGPAGLAATYRLTHKHVLPTVLLERAPVFGGLAAGFHHRDYILDYGPHRLHPSTYPEVLADLQSFLGDDLELRRRNGQIRLGESRLPFPIGPRSLLALGPRRIAALTTGLAAAKLNHKNQADNYEMLLVHRLGQPLYDLFYGPYAEKTWGMAGTAISLDQADKRVNQRGLLDLVAAALGRGPGQSYYYPRGGFGRIPQAYAHALAGSKGVSLHTEASVTAIEVEGDRIRALQYEAAGHSTRELADHLVWSAPLSDLVRMLSAPRSVVDAVASLRHRAAVLCYVALDTPRVGNIDTYYFPAKDVPFNRVAELKNFSHAMTPADRTVLCLDIPCNTDDPVFTMTDDELGEYVLPWLQTAGLAQPAQVLEVFSRRSANVYPIYDLVYHKAMDTTMEWLGRLRNLWLIGRQGLFLHNNTHHSLYMGYRAADAIAGGSQEKWDDALNEFASFRVAD